MNIQDILYQEQRIAVYMEEFVDALVKKIETTPVNGVQPVSKSPNCFVVRLSTIRRNNLVLSPEYYCPVSQAHYIRLALDYCKTATSLLEKINQIAADGYVKINNNRYLLNKNTIQILQDWCVCWKQ